MTKTIDKPTLFRPSDLDEMLGRRLDRFDVEGIIKNATIVNPRTGSRYWNVFGDELEEMIWFHEYERTAFHVVDEAPAAYCLEGVGSIIETTATEQAPHYTASNPRSAELVVKAAEASILADDLYHLLRNRGIKRPIALENTSETMSRILGDMGFVSVR